MRMWGGWGGASLSRQAGVPLVMFYTPYPEGLRICRKGIVRSRRSESLTRPSPLVHSAHATMRFEPSMVSPLPGFPPSRASKIRLGTLQFCGSNLRLFMSFGGFHKLKRKLCAQKLVPNMVLAGPPGFPLDPGGQMQASETLIYNWCEQRKWFWTPLGGPLWALESPYMLPKP